MLCAISDQAATKQRPIPLAPSCRAKRRRCGFEITMSVKNQWATETASAANLCASTFSEVEVDILVLVAPVFLAVVLLDAFGEVAWVLLVDLQARVRAL